MNVKGFESLSDKISSILTTAPGFHDPEDDINEESTARVVEKDDDIGEEDDNILSKFRSKNIEFLENVDEKYTGAKVSRRDLRTSDEDSESEDLSESDVDEDESDEDEQDDEGTSEEEEHQSGSEQDESPQGDKKSDNFVHLRDSSASAQMKGNCVTNQLHIWENLLEMRIQLQKCLVTSNKLPQNENFKKLQASADTEVTQQVSNTKSNIANLLGKMLTLQDLLIKQHPETKKMVKNKPLENKNEDEEIPSDTDEEPTAANEEEEEIDAAVPKKRLKMGLYGEEIARKHEKYKEYRNSVIKHWNDKTKTMSGKTASGAHSVLNQIDHILTDKTRLIKRTQLKRSNYQILGEALQEGDNLEEYNNEIYDDDDFYHQLLKELIEFKSGDVTDPVALGRQWLQLQNMRSKMKRKIDTRATKGRKIRYTVHTKLVNFMAPIEENSWTDEAKTELFNSLFGKKQHGRV